MKKFEYEGKWYQELDPKDYRIFDKVRGLVRDGEDKVWQSSTILACVNLERYQFISIDATAWKFCAIPCDPPESRLMTCRELSELINCNYGQVRIGELSTLYPYFSYSGGNDNKKIEDTIRIRSWNSTEWIKPTIDIYNKFLNKDHQ